MDQLSPRAISYFEARERRLTLALRVAEVLNALVRPALAVLFSAAYISMAMMGVDPGDAFIAVTTAVVLWFFKAGDDETSQRRLTDQQTEMVDLAKRLPPPAEKD
jgi:hypothetical protein